MTSTGHLVTTAWGSAGDLLPFVTPVAAVGADTLTWAVPRGQGAYLRALGTAALSLGDGSELGVFGDDALITCDGDGWVSWCHMWDGYVAPFVEAADGHSGAADAWGADAVLATDFAVHGRLAAHRAGVPCVTMSIYPQHAGDAPTPVGLVPERLLQAVLARVEGDEPACDRIVHGEPSRRVLLHDPSLLPDDRLEAFGFPEAAIVPAPSHEAAFADWVASGDSPVVVVTMGSFLGRRGADRWRRIVHDVRSTGARCAVVGCPREVAAEVAGPDVLTVPWLPMDHALASADAVVHHGGLGTTVAAMRAACPAVVVPIAFDQAYNARLVERVGAGLDGSAQPVDACLRRLVGSGEAHDAVAAVADGLVDARRATDAVAARCRELLAA